MSDQRFSRDLDWNLLKTFYEIARAGAITDAALRLNRKQPSVSQALRRLEMALGIKLCRRTARRLELTNEGSVVAETGRYVAESVEDLPRRLADASSSTHFHVRLLLISNLVCPVIDAAIAAFNRRYMDAEIDIEVAPWSELQDMLLREEGDVAVAPSRAFHEDISYYLLFHEVNRAFCGRDHPLYGKHFDSPDKLSGYGFILTESDEPDELREFRLSHGLGVHVSGRCERLEEAKRLTKLGLGICFLPEELAARERAEGLLWPLLPDANEPAIPVYVMARSGGGEAPERFLEYLVDTERAEQHAGPNHG